MPSLTELGGGSGCPGPTGVCGPVTGVLKPDDPAGVAGPLIDCLENEVGVEPCAGSWPCGVAGLEGRIEGPAVAPGDGLNALLFIFGFPDDTDDEGGPIGRGDWPPGRASWGSEAR